MAGQCYEITYLGQCSDDVYEQVKNVENNLVKNKTSRDSHSQ